MNHRFIRSVWLLAGLLVFGYRCTAQRAPSPSDSTEISGQQSSSQPPAQETPAVSSAEQGQQAPAAALPAAPVPPIVNFSKPRDVDPDRYVSWPQLLPNVWHDQKPIWWDFPASVAHGHHLVPVIATVALTTGLIVADRYDSAYFHRTQTFNGFDRALSGKNTALATWALPLGFDFVSFLRKDHYGERTAVLAGEAVIDAEVVTAVMKDIDRRWRPWEASTQGNGNYTDAWFKTHGSYLGGSGNFPSGHTIAAFAVATVFADRYPNPVWHQWLAYGAAGAIGFSRISLQSHFPSDVFLGAVIAYSIAHYVVLRH